MHKNKTETLVEELAAPVAKELNLELVDVDFIKEGAHWYLRVFLDKPGGLDVEDCRAVSERLSDLLDEKDPIPQAYFLEVSSPGLERPLKDNRDFAASKGKLIAITTYGPINGQKAFTGTLEEFDESSIILISKAGKKLVVPRDKVASVKLTVDF